MSNPELNDDIVKFHLLSDTGLDFHSPASFVNVVYIDHVPEIESWSVKRRRRLIWKLKIKTARLNKLMVVLLMIFSTLAIISLIVLLLMIVANQVISIMLGVLGAQLILLAYYFWKDKFECNPNYINVKHKGRIYR